MGKFHVLPQIAWSGEELAMLSLIAFRKRTRLPAPLDTEGRAHQCPRVVITVAMTCCFQIFGCLSFEQGFSNHQVPPLARKETLSLSEYFHHSICLCGINWSLVEPWFSTTRTSGALRWLEWLLGRLLTIRIERSPLPRPGVYAQLVGEIND